MRLQIARHWKICRILQFVPAVQSNEIPAKRHEQLKGGELVFELAAIHVSCALQ